MGNYTDTAAQELVECNAKLKYVRSVVDSMIADFEGAPTIKRLVSKKDLYDINEHITSAQTTLELIVNDMKRRKE